MPTWNDDGSVTISAEEIRTWVNRQLDVMLSADPDPSALEENFLRVRESLDRGARSGRSRFKLDE